LQHSDSIAANLLRLLSACMQSQPFVFEIMQLGLQAKADDL